MKTMIKIWRKKRDEKSICKLLKIMEKVKIKIYKTKKILKKHSNCFWAPKFMIFFIADKCKKILDFNYKLTWLLTCTISEF